MKLRKFTKQRKELEEMKQRSEQESSQFGYLWE